MASTAFSEQVCCSSSEDRGMSLLSVPDLEPLEEICASDIEGLLQSITSSTARVSVTTAVAESDETVSAAPQQSPSEIPSEPAEAAQRRQQQQQPVRRTSSLGSTPPSALPRRQSSRQDSVRSPIMAEFHGVAPQRLTAGKAHPATVTSNAAASASTQSLPRLEHISDTEVMEAEQRRWDCQLVQECWMHQELHGMRWDEQQLLKHGATYRPRAIASRTAVKMTHTKSLCIALNVGPAILENAGETQEVADSGDGSAASASMPSLSSPEAEEWSPLFMWRSPAFTPGDEHTVLTQLSQCLGEQYESLAPRPLPTSCCANARASDLVQTLSDARKDAGDAKVVFHYLARGVPRPRNGNLYLTNAASGAGYAGPPLSTLSLDTLRSRVGFPLVFIADCAGAGDILNYYIRMCEEQHQQRYFTSSREYQLKSSRQVSAADLDNLADSQASGTSESFDRAGSGADLGSTDNLRRARGAAGSSGGGLDSTPPPQSAILQDFYFIGATGSSYTTPHSSGPGGAGGRGVRGKGSGSGAAGGVYADAGAGAAGQLGGGGAGNASSSAATSSHEAGALHHHARLPSDILSSCLTTPLRMAVLWFIAERPELQALHPLLLRLIPGTLTDKKTPLGQLQWHLQSIIECIAWSTLSLSEYSRLFREDVYVAPLFRGCLLAERIIVGGLGGTLSVYPPVATTHTHVLWRTWDNLVERALVAVLRAVRPAPPRCASVLEFRGWLDEQVTSWKYTRPDLLALQANCATLAAAVPGDRGGGQCHYLPSTPDESAVLIPSLLTEALRGMQAQLEGITQQSFERPRMFFAEIVGLHLSGFTAGCGARAGSNSGGGAITGGGAREERGARDGQQRPRLALRGLADQYSNSLRSSYPSQQQIGLALSQTVAGANAAAAGKPAIPPAPSATDLTANSARGLSGTGAPRAGHPQQDRQSSSNAGVARHSSSRAAQQHRHGTDGKSTAAAPRGMPERVDSHATVASGRYQRASQATLSGLSSATYATSAASPTAALNAATARVDSRGSPNWPAARKAEYVTNLHSSATSTAAQAMSFHHTATLPYLGGNSGGDYTPSSPASPVLYSASTTTTTPLLQHTFPFMDRMPLLLQALLVAAHREKATDLICRLVDCGPAAILQCAEANIYRFVLDRYWNRPDLRFLMPATLFIFCKSCYADPELIGNAKQRDIAIKACAEILQSPVDVPPLSPPSGILAEEAPGAWQNATLGPYATPYGQRLLAAALLTLIALHNDDGREACHRYGVFQLCCQLLQRTRDDAPLLSMGTLDATLASMGAGGGSGSNRAEAFAAAFGPSAPPPIPRAPPLGGACSPCQAHSQTASRSAGVAAGSVPIAAEEPPPPPSIATPYHVTLLTLFVSLLCNWKPSASAADGGDDDDNDAEDEEDAELRDHKRAKKLLVLSPPLDGTVHALPPTTPEVLAAGLATASSALLRFMYSDTSILRGAALRCLIMVLISPAPSHASRVHFVEAELHRFYSEPIQRCELNTDLRLEVMGMGYTTFRWLLDQLREDLPVEEVGQFVALWIYKWFKLTAQGKTPASPFIASGRTRGAAASDSGTCCQGDPASHHSVHPPLAGRTWVPPPASVSFRASSIVKPGSVYSHRRANVLVPAARSLYPNAAHGAAGNLGSASLINYGTWGGLRQHLTEQDHQRLQTFLPALSNLVRLFFEHTQDACPYVRTYARKVVMEEFSFLHQSWYDDYAPPDGHVASPGEPDYRVSAGGASHHHPHHRPHNRGQTPHYDSASSPPTAAGDPLTASSVKGGGDLTTYLPLRELLGSEGSFDDAHASGGAAAHSPAPATRQAHHVATVPHMSNTTGAATVEVEDVPDPHPAVLRRFISRLLRIASAHGSGTGSGSASSSLPHRASRSSHRRRGDSGESEGDGEDDDGGRSGSRRGRSGHNRNASNDRETDEDDETGGHRHNRGSRDDAAAGRRLGHRTQRGGSPFYPDDPLESAGVEAGEEDEVEEGGTLLDSETLALHPLWAMDASSMTNFAYGALSFLERFMLEETDDSDPRHPMNLEKENALRHYCQCVERNVRTSAHEAMLSGREASLVQLLPGGASVAAAAKVRGGQINSATGTRALSAGTAAFAPTPFHCLGVGDIGQAGIPGYGSRYRRRSRRRGGSSAVRRHGDVAERCSRVAGEVDVILFHPSEPLVITSTTGGLLSVWSYGHVGQPGSRDGEEDEEGGEHARLHQSDSEEDGDDEAGSSSSDAEDPDNEAEALRLSSTRRAAAETDGATVAAPQRLRARVQFFLRDVVGRSHSDLLRVAQPRFMYDRFNPNSGATSRRAGGGGGRGEPRRVAAEERRGAGGGGGARGSAGGVGCPAGFLRRAKLGRGMAGGGGGSRPGGWMERAEAANAIAALPSSYQHGHPHFHHGVGDLHLVDAAHHPLICAVRRFGAVEIFSHFNDRRRVRRVTSFETGRFGENDGAHFCVSSYQPSTGLLFVSGGEGNVSAWDLGNEQRMASIGTLACAADALSYGGASTISALQASPCSSYEYLVGSYGKPVCLFDLRDSGSGAARCGYAHPSLQFHATGHGKAVQPLSSLCVRVCYSRRYPHAAVAGYACGTVAVWDRRYARQPALLFGTALDGVAAGDAAAGTGMATSAMPVGGGASTMIRQLDVHPCSRRFLTLATSPSSLQLLQPTSLNTVSDGGRLSGSPAASWQPSARVVETYPLSTGDDDSGHGPGTACFHDFSPMLGVGAGSTIRLYGAGQLSSVVA